MDQFEQNKTEFVTELFFLLSFHQHTSMKTSMCTDPTINTCVRTPLKQMV